jgi:GT2 family glycosyltransferase
MNELVVVVILNYNGWRDTAACVSSCQKLTYTNFRILVLDNGSTDGSETLLRERYPEMEIIQTGKNLGFAGGNNAGIRQVLEQKADFVWLLNNDTIVEPQCLALMVRAAGTDDRVGMVGSKIYYHHAPKTLWFAGGEIDLGKGGLTRHIGQDERDVGSYNKLGETGYITGCSILASREMIEEVGLLEEEYFLYFEDVDWSLRARRKGWKLLYQPEAKLWHKEGAQTDKIYTERFIYYFLRNRFFCVRRFAPQKILRCHLLQAKTALFFIKESLGKGMGASWRTLRAVLAAYGDFFFKHRMGFREGL